MCEGREKERLAGRQKENKNNNLVTMHNIPAPPGEVERFLLFLILVFDGVRGDHAAI